MTDSTGDEAGSQAGEALLQQTAPVGPVPGVPLSHPVVHLPACRGAAGQVQASGHATGLQPAAEDEGHRGGDSGRGI